MAKEVLTPMMKQFFDLKRKHPDALLLFRCGDFYETYCEDATIAAQILGITLTRRNNGGTTAVTEMAGFPYHALDTYLPRLIRAGRRVAICDQLEDPKKTKTLVKRGITELVTPGVTMSDNVLNHKENNFLAAVHFGKTAVGIALLDISTGEFLTAQGTPDYVDKLMANFQPKEVLHERGKEGQFQQHFGQKLCTYQLDDWAFGQQTAEGKLLTHFGVRNLKGFGVEHLPEGIAAAGAIMQYLELTQHTQLKHITTLSRIEEERYMRLDKFTVRSLELLLPMGEGGKCLMDVLDRTVTPMGARLMRRWVVFPPKDEKTINQRLDAVEHFFRHPDTRDQLEEQLRRMGDFERITSRLSAGRVSPREVMQLRVALDAIEPVRAACLASDNPTLQAMGQQMHLCRAARDRIRREIVPDPPANTLKGNFIRSGVNDELDELRKIHTGGKDYLLQLQHREAQATGIQSLKVGFNNVFGYYLEVRNTHKHLVPPQWVRKQTLAQAERYITDELKQYEEKILGAEDKILALENEMFTALVASLAEGTAQIQANANVAAKLDCLLSFAAAAREHGYTRPIVEDSDALDIRQGRHPVIERMLPPGERYVPNDVMLDTHSQQIMIITGPNMAGKSALLRQTALIALMAHMGSFVPAESARIGLVDKIFTRVGASDNISAGESTFMVEMSEAANILNNASPRSLILFDELGRGTSTYDGISIAWAIVEWLHDNPKCHPRTLFATHYHELNEMAQTHQRVRNYNVSVREQGGRVIFLRRLEEGGSEHSFGIHVARLSGMPTAITKRAEQVLAQLEAAKQGEVSGKIDLSAPQGGTQMSFFQLDDPVLAQVRDQILDMDVDNLTPLQALNKLSDIKRIVTGKR